MKTIDPGHEYLLDSYDDGEPVRLVFVKREGEGYPFNTGHHPGTNCQEVIRALIERVKYLQSQIPSVWNENVLLLLRQSLNQFESRAADRHRRVLPPFAFDEIEMQPTCPGCGHIGCEGQHRAAPATPVAQLANSGPTVEALTLDGLFGIHITQDSANFYFTFYQKSTDSVWAKQGTMVLSRDLKHSRPVVVDNFEAAPSTLSSKAAQPEADPVDDDRLKELGRNVVVAWLDRRDVKTLRNGDAVDLMIRVGAAIEAERQPGTTTPSTAAVAEGIVREWVAGLRFGHLPPGEVTRLTQIISKHLPAQQPEVHELEVKLDQTEELLRQNKVVADAEIERLKGEVGRLTKLIDTPHTDDWLRAVPLEAAHQVKRWGVEHDVGKTPFDWFWLIGYLAQKAALSAVAGDIDKAKHHTVSTAAVLLNWFRRLTGDEMSFQPGIDPMQRGAEAALGDSAAALQQLKEGEG